MGITVDAAVNVVGEYDDDDDDEDDDEDMLWMNMGSVGPADSSQKQ